MLLGAAAASNGEVVNATSETPNPTAATLH